MQYDIYYEKVNKFAAFMKKVFKFMWLILTVLAVIIAAVVTLLALKGKILSESSVKSTYVYGDSIEYKADAFLSKVKPQYFVDGAWGDTPPSRVGSYKVRGAAKSGFGGYKYSEEHAFEITKRDVSVSIPPQKITYGDTPKYGFSILAAGDQLVCEKLKINYLGATEAERANPQCQVEPNKESIKITNASGVDVTDCYNINVDGRKLKVTPRPLNVTVSNKSVIYNNTVLTFDGYETDGNEVFGDTVEAVFTANIIDVGEVENTPSLRVVSKSGLDVSHFYAVKCTVGKLTVEKRPLIIKTESASKVYDGKPLINSEATIAGEYGVCDGQTLNLSFPMIVNVWKQENLPTYKVTDDVTGQDKTYNYSIFIEAGTLEVSARELVIVTQGGGKVYDGIPLLLDEYDIVGKYDLCENHTIELNFTEFIDVISTSNIPEYTILGLNGADVTSNYDVIIQGGGVAISKRPIEIVVGSAEKTFDGTPLECPEYDVVGEYDFIEGHSLTKSFPSLTYAGTVKNEMSIKSIFDKDKNNVLRNYLINYTHGTLTVNKRDITITTPDGEWMYDSYDHSTEAIFSTDIGYDNVMYTKSTSIRYAGSAKNEVVVKLYNETLGDVSKSYNITYKYGTLTVTKRPITIYTPSITQIYDGQPLVGNWAEAFGGEGIADRDNFFVTLSSQITDVGSVKNEFYDYYFHTDTSGYDEPTLEEPDWEVMPVDEPTTSADKLDGSDDFVREENTEPADELPDIDVDPTVMAKNSYDITWVCGTLTVIPREVHIRPADDSKPYDGEPLFATDFVYSESTPYEFVNGHKVYVEYSGAVYDIGTEISRIVEGSVVVTDASGNNVTRNYRVVSNETGLLTVYPRPVTITTGSFKKEYDGLPLTYPVYNITSGSFLDGHQLFLQIDGSQTEVGRSPNTVPEDSIRVDLLMPGADPVDVTKYYDITVVEGSLTVTDPHLELLEITPISLFKDYDGEYLYAINMLEEDGLLGELLARGYHYSVEVSGSQREVGIGKSTIMTFHLFDENWKDVTHKYNVVFNEGKLEVRAATVRVFLYELQKYYDGTPLEFRQDDYSIIYLPDECKLSLTLNISLTDVGEITLEQINENLDQYVSFRVFKDGVDITRNCKLIFDVFDGTHKDYVPIKISPRAIELTAVSAEKYYDGKALTSSRYEITKGTLAEGHKIYVTVEGSITEVGKTENVIRDFYIIDTVTGRIVTDNYTVKTIDGTLTVRNKQ